MTIPIGAFRAADDLRGLRTLSYYDFAALQTATLPLGPVRLLAGRRRRAGHRLFLHARAGAAARARRGWSGRCSAGSLGADAALGPEDGRLGLGARHDDACFWEPSFSTAQGETLQVFGDRLSANLSYSYAF